MVAGPSPARAVTGAGRPPATSLTELEHVALDLFTRQGFEETTVEQIARAAGIGRRTFFRYFRSKNDVAWGDFDAHLARFRAHFGAVPAHVPLGQALFDCILAFNEFSPDELPWHRQRMALLLSVPALQAHSALRYRAWRQVVAGFVAGRRREAETALVPQVVAHGALGAALAAYEQWLSDDSAFLTALLRRALRAWLAGLPMDEPSTP